MPLPTDSSPPTTQAEAPRPSAVRKAARGGTPTNTAFFVDGLLCWCSVVLLLVQLSGTVHISLAAGAIELVALVLCVPFLHGWLTRRFGFVVNGKRVAPLVLALLFGAAVVASDAKEQREAAAAAAVVERVAQKKAQLQAEFAANKVDILRKVQAHLDADQSEQAYALAMWYPVSDADLANLRRTAGYFAAYKELAGGKPLSVEQRLALWKRIAEVEPDDARVKEQLESLEAEYKRVLAERADAAKAAQVAATINAQLSKWDGSHPAATSALRETMKDPSSFEYLGTFIMPGPDGATLNIRYRARNSFGALVPESRAVELDAAGNVRYVVR